MTLFCVRDEVDCPLQVMSKRRELTEQGSTGSSMSEKDKKLTDGVSDLLISLDRYK